MLELYRSAPDAVARSRSSPVGPYLDDFAAALKRAGYPGETGGRCISYAVHLGVWADRRGIGVAGLDDAALDRFVAHLSTCRCPGYKAGSHKHAGEQARVFMKYLRDGEINATRKVEMVPVDPLVAAFCNWMQRHRGTDGATLRNFLRTAGLLVAHMGSDTSRYSAEAIRATFRELTAGRGNSTAKWAATVIRAFLRYLAIEGRCRPGLDAAIPAVAHWRLASLPRYTSVDNVERIIDSCDLQTSVGLRDRAILLLVARLGLRAGDIVALRIPDCDWKTASVGLLGKGRREVRLPLSQEVGDAVLAYLDGPRRGHASDRIFFTARAPYRPLSRGAAIGSIVKRAIARAGVSVPTQGAHLLRHSVATAMLGQGVSLPGISVVLRHRSIETTAIYAKVNVEMLRSVARPWLGGETC